MRRARSRPPHLESRTGARQFAPPPTLEERLERGGVAGPATALGPAELRRLVERANEGHLDQDVLDLAWIAVTRTFGATPTASRIDPAATIAAVRRAVDRIIEVSRTGARVALATGRPASLLTLYIALAGLAGRNGAEVADQDDSTPMRLDGRTGRWLRWVDGVAVSTDGDALCATHGTEAAEEWLFLLARPALVIADGPFADVALDAGIEVIVPAGLEHCSLVAGPAGPGDRRRFVVPPLVVPMWTDRPPSAYRPLLEDALATLG